ncbi:dynein regulatory complex subunit 4 isoform X1 [Anguilla anguilla]|uniref:dynein regulatory complex subunit 4 isoform X1 n=1 Tax=Anguilla anguilla TaxID=7936 RepID=UPI0015ABF79A|nr:dynein regulatory complex subunit 4 isoform X1 [Anguilla anguilla]
MMTSLQLSKLSLSSAGPAPPFSSGRIRDEPGMRREYGKKGEYDLASFWDSLQQPPKKKDKGGKGKTPAAADSSTAEVSVDQLQEQIELLKDELDKERDERNFFQMEGDKIRAFWDITKRQLQEKTADLRNKDRELEEAEENHQEEVKDYKQKVKHLLYEHQNSLSEQKADKTTAKKVLQTEHIEREFELRKEIRNLKNALKAMELSSENLVKKLKLKNDEEMIQKQNDFERQLQENKAKYEKRMLVMQREVDLRWTTEVHKIEERKNSQINTLMKDHDRAIYSMKNYYNDTIINNMSLINSQRVEIDATLKKVDDLEKENAKVVQHNRRLAEPLEKAKEEVAELQKVMASYKKDKASLVEARKRLKAADKEMEDMKWECEVLQQMLRKVQEEKDNLAHQLTNTILEVQQKSTFKNHLENKMNSLSKTGEKAGRE